MKRGFKIYYRLRLLDVDPLTGCWIWLGHQVQGYGVINARLPDDTRRIHRTAQRYFYLLYRSDPGPNKDIAHRCHRRSCCNPRHLRPATRLSNVGDWFVDQKFTDEQVNQVAKYMALDLPVSVIADLMCAPRPYITRLVSRITWERYQTSFEFSIDASDTA